ncbi:MAG: insulinase family protein [Deltaproteobacteria bacterium]|nr:insulinase family protein [Deltaproteobacteria bacterium]
MKNRRADFAIWALAGSLLLLLGCAGPRPAWDNGLRILLLEDHSRPMVSFGLAVRRGTAIETAGKEGVAVLCAEVMQRGAGDRDALQMANAVDQLGATLGIGAGWDSIQLGVSGLARDADTLLQIVSDVTLRPRFDERETEKARDEQLADLASGLDNPRTLLSWQLGRTLYPGHRYGLPRAGQPEAVRQLTAADVRNFYESIFLPNNAIFYATGDFDSEVLLAQVERALGGWVSGSVPEPVTAPPPKVPEARKIVVLDRPDLVQVQIAVSHEGLQRTDPRRVPASLLNNVLGGSGFSSRLTVRIRSDAGLTYGIHSRFSLRRRPGRFGISTSTRVDQARPALDLLLEEVGAIRKDRPPTEDELRNAKAFNVGHFALGLETAEAVMGSLVNLDIYGLPEDSLDTFRGRVQQVTRAEITELAKELLHPERAAIVLVGPAATLVPELESLGPIEVVTW